MEDERAKDQARAQLNSIISMIDNLNIANKQIQLLSNIKIGLLLGLI